MANQLGETIVRIVGDNSGLDNAINQSESKLKKFGDQAMKIGKGLTTYVTLPIVALGAAFVKAASDAEETNSKFNAVFKEQAAEVRSWTEEFSKSVGRSTTENIGFLGTIQDTLVPLGFMRDRAAEMSKATVALATDLASFNNLPTADVVRDIQSALVGNTETLRKFGVVASQEAIIQEAINSGLIENKNQLDANSKAQAIYQLLVKGTADAQGDALRTAGSTANQFRALKSEVIDLAEKFGRELLPAVQNVVGSVRNIVSWFADLDESSKRVILTIGGIAAAIGPLVIGIAGVTKAVTVLNTAMTFLAANPIVAVVAGVAALTIGLIALGRSRRKAQLEELREDFEGVESAVGLASEEIDAIQHALHLGSMDQFGDAAEQVDALSRNLGVSKQAVIDIGLHSDDVTDAYKEQLEILKLQLQERAAELAYTDLQIAREIGRAAANARGEEMLRQQQAERAAAELEAERKRTAIQDRANEAYASIARRMQEINRLAEVNAEIGVEYNAEEEKRKAILDEINSLISDGVGLNTSYAGAVEYIVSLYGDLLKQTEELADFGERRAKAIKEEAKEFVNYAELRRESEQRRLNAIAEREAKEAEAMAKRKQALMNQLRETAEAEAERERLTAERIDAQRQLEDDNFVSSTAGMVAQLKQQQEETQKFVDWWQENYADKITNATQEMFTTIASIALAKLDAEIQAAETGRDAALDAIDREIESRREAGATYDDLIAQREATDERYDAKLRQLQYEQAVRERKIAIFNALIDTAQAIIGFLADPSGVAGVILSGLAGATGAAQLAAIRSAPLPALATGGIVPASMGGTPVIVGEGGSSEAVIPLDQLGSLLSEIPGGGGLGQPTHLTITMDSQPFLDAILPASQDGRILVDARAVV